MILKGREHPFEQQMCEDSVFNSLSQLVILDLSGNRRRASCEDLCHEIGGLKMSQ